MVCTACGAENRSGRKFCARCAAPLALLCPRCEIPNEPGDLYCGGCAAPLTSTSPVGSGIRSVVTTERRLVTVLFADLVGFTPFAEERDAEDVREALTRYFDLAADVIGRYGGTVEKFIGDAVMAVWGAPAAHEDDAERAVRAGLELVDAVRAIGPSVQARTGILTGEAAVTFGATNQGLVAGDLVNTASRLQSVAPPGAVLVGEATRRAASKAILFEAAGEQVLKGKASSVPAWRALRVVAQRGGRNRSEALEAPFVGRDDELRLLKDLFHATTREGRARLVSVIGPAGIGKSRLAWELHKYLDGIVEPVWWHDGRSPAYGEGVTFWALGEMVRGRCGLAETDDEPTTRARVAETLAVHVPDESERRWIEPALLTLLGVERGIGSEQLFGAWRTFFERLAATAPAVMVFEDFHHADSGTRDFVDHLLGWSRHHPIYVVTLARPELLAEREAPEAGRRNFASLYLEPLPEPAMRALLAGLVPGLPEPTVHSIVARAEGVPLYTVETVRMLVADGRLVPEGDGTYRLVGELSNLPVPETLTALIASRLDALDPEDHRLVSDAAVLGQSFTLAGLAAVSGVAEPELEPRLRRLAGRDLLALEADPRSPGRGQYAFIQALVREVAYNTLARVDRKSRHLAAARYFETLGTDEIPAVLAGHYLAARENAPEGPEREALAAQARVTLRRAAERAADLGAHDQARAFFDEALSITTEPADRAEQLVRAGEEASAAGRHDAAEQYLRTALELRRELGDRSAIAHTVTRLGWALLADFRMPAAVALLEPASVEFADLKADPAVIALGGQLARAYFLTGDDPRRAITAADPVLEAAEHADLGEVLADTLITRGSALADLGRTVEALALVRAGTELAESLDLRVVTQRGYNNRAALERERDPRTSLETGRAGLQLARRLGYRHGIALLLANVGAAALRTGDWASAMSELDAALAEDFEASDRMTLVNEALGFHLLRGEPVADLVDELTRLVAAAPDPGMRVVYEDVNAFIALLSGRLLEAREGWHRCSGLLAPGYPGPWVFAARAALWAGDADAASADLVGLDATGVHGPALEAIRTTVRAGLAALDGRPGDALVLYREARRTQEGLGLLWDEALTGIDMATLLGPSDPEVRTAAERSREILVRLEAKPFIDRLERAMAEGGGPADGEDAGSPLLARSVVELLAHPPA